MSTPREPLPEAAEAFDNLLLDIVKNGQEVVDEDGNTQRIQPTAAMLNVVRQRLKDAGMSGTKPNSATEGLGGVVAALRQQGRLKLTGTDGPLPPMSEDDDAATR